MLERVLTSLLGIAVGLTIGFTGMTFLAYSWSHTRGVDLVYERVQQ